MKELFKNPETIKNFKLLHYILLSNGLNYINNDFYVDYDGNVDYHFSPWTGRGSAYDILPNKLFDFLDTFFESIKDEILDFLESDSDSRATISLTYETKNRKFLIDEHVLVMDYQSSYNEFEVDKKELLEDMVQWKESGKLIIKVDFNGSGDSGYIDDYGITNEGDRHNLSAVWEDELYRILERNHGGWEINEGSEGTFIINNENQTIDLDFRMNVEESSTGYEFTHQFEF